MDRAEVGFWLFVISQSIKIALDRAPSPSQALYRPGVEAPGGVDKYYPCNISYYECSEGK